MRPLQRYALVGGRRKREEEEYVAQIKRTKQRKAGRGEIDETNGEGDDDDDDDGGEKEEDDDEGA